MKDIAKKAAPAPTGPRPAAGDARGGVRIVFWLLVALGAVGLLIGLFAALAWTGIRSSDVEIRRAQQSLQQMENVQRIEAAFNAYLLGEVRRRLTGESDSRESPEAGRLRGALFAYRRQLAEEISLARSDDERDDERAGIVRAAAMSDIFESIERESMLDRARGGAETGDPAALSFLSHIAANHDRIVREIVTAAAADERTEAEQAFARLETLRRELLTAGGAVAIAFLAALIAFGALFYRGMMRPIRRLTTAVEGWRSGAPAHRAPGDLPGEFALFASRFNQMMDRIDTEQLRLQSEVAARTADLKSANASLMEIDRTRRAFFANISHELRTPLTVLLGEARIALLGSGDERGALERIAASGGFLKRRIDDLMQLARSDDGALKLGSAPFELTEAVGAAVKTVEAYARTKDVAVRFAPGPALHLTGDRGALNQAALALIDNAIKFSPAGSEVIVSTDASGFSVKDSGPGFGEVDPAALFDRYAQADHGRSRGGAGLGLAIVKWIADQHGAALKVADRPEGGAAISMEFKA